MNINELVCTAQSFISRHVSQAEICDKSNTEIQRFKLQLHGAIHRLRFYSNSLIHILSLSNSYNNAASIKMNRGDNRTV